MKAKAVLFIIGVFLISSCASIVSKSSYPVSITSSPDQAEFVITNKHGMQIHSGKTPSTVTLKSSCGFFQGEDYKITFNKDGYSPNSATISSSMDGWYVGNLLFGGLIGILIVDPATGAMWKLPPAISSSMDKKDTALNSSGKSLYVLSYNSIPDSVKGSLVSIAR